MTLFLAICLLMVVAGAACVGWVLRWYMVFGDEAVDPREAARHDTATGASA